MGVSSTGKVLIASVSEEKADPISGCPMDYTQLPRKLSALNLHFHYRESLQNVTLGISLYIHMLHKVRVNK